MRGMAEGVGFEPTKAVKPCRFSRPVHSTALPALRGRDCNSKRPADALLRLVTEKERLQVVEKTLPERRGHDALVVARDQAALFGLP